MQVYRGNTSDPRTVNDQVEKLRGRFQIQHVILVGERGTLTQARVEDLQKLGGIDWVSALRSKAIRQLLDQALIQLSLFDQRDLVEIVSPDYPGERLVVCRAPLLAEGSRRTAEAQGEDCRNVGACDQQV